MAVFHSESFNNPSGNTLLWDKVPEVGGEWLAYNYTDGEIHACHIGASQTDVRFRGLTTAINPVYVVSRDSDADLDLRVTCQIGFRTSNGGRAGVLLKVNTSTNTYYMADVEDSVCYLRRVVNDVSTILAQAAWPYAGGSVTKELCVEFIKETNTLIVYRQGEKLFEYVDATPITAPGKVGIIGQGESTTATMFDFFRAEDYEQSQENIFVLDRFETLNRDRITTHTASRGGPWTRLEGGTDLWVAGDIWSTVWVRNMAYQNAGSTTIHYLPTTEPVTTHGARFSCDIGIYTSASTAVSGLVLRVDPTSRAHYRCYGLNGQFYVAKYTSASVFTTLAQVAYSWPALQTTKNLEIELRPSGSSLRIVVYDNGTEIVDILDSSPLDRGYVGVIGTTGGLWDNVQGEEIIEANTVGALTSTGTGAFNAAGVTVLTKPTTFTASATSTNAYQTFWFATGYLNSASSAALVAESVEFITRSAALTAAGTTTITARGRSTAQSSATFEGSQSVFSPISNSLIEGEGIFKAEGASAAVAFVSQVVNGSKITSASTSAAAFKGQRIGNTFTAVGSSTATFWQFGRVNAGALTVAGSSDAEFWQFGRIEAATMNSAGKATTTFGDIDQGRAVMASVASASFRGLPINTGVFTITTNARAVDFTSTGLQSATVSVVATSTTLFRTPGGARFHAYII